MINSTFSVSSIVTGEMLLWVRMPAGRIRVISQPWLIPPEAKAQPTNNYCLAFTGLDLDAEHRRLLGMGVEIASETRQQPWGTRNLSLHDPDGYLLFLRQF